MANDNLHPIFQQLLAPFMPELTSLTCVKRIYEFNDGSRVMFTPSVDNPDLFRVDIVIKGDEGLPRASWAVKPGPPSEASALHWLKQALKDQKDEERP